MTTGTLPMPPEKPSSRFSLRRILLGSPLATHEMPRQTVGKLVGLAVFASDALSSTAYATDEILFVLAVAGPMFFHLSIPISLAIGALLFVLTLSYRQTIFAYPNGGGAYIVARDNLGELAAQTAGAALLTDYILTVSVSIASGVAQIASAFPTLWPLRVELSVGMIAVMMLVNLRGVRESGRFFAVPTYFFLILMLTMLAVGFGQVVSGRLPTVSGVRPEVAGGAGLTLFLLLRAFASGSVAVTGTEAISNGITAFSEPKSRNAAATMAWMSSLLGVMFVGTTVLASRAHALPAENETIISQLARTIYGPGLLHVLTLAATTLILILAANTSFADFPRLAALHAADGFLPRQLTYKGSRLVFSWGIAILAAISSVLVILFRANVTALIPLYAIGVFLSFTMSQLGMVVRWTKIGQLGPEEVLETKASRLQYHPHWRRKRAVNAVGAVVTFVVMLVQSVTKFIAGAWIVVILIPAMVWTFFRIHHHYQMVRRMLSIEGTKRLDGPAPVIHVVLISGVHAAALRQINFVESLGVKWSAVYVAIDEDRAAEVRRKWDRFFPHDQLTILPSPFRDLVGPVRQYVEQLRKAHPEAYIHVVVSQILMDHYLEQALHQNATVVFKLALQHIPRVVVTDVAYPVHLSGLPMVSSVPSASQAADLSAGDARSLGEHSHPSASGGPATSGKS